MVYVTIATIVIILFLLVAYIIYRLSKELGSLNSFLDVIEKEAKQYEKDKRIINRNNNLAHDELVAKLRKLQYKK